MYRKGLIMLLLNNPLGITEIARHMEVAPGEVADDIEHLMKSLKHSEYRLLVTPGECRKCGFTFHKDKFHRPGKCPQCHGNWISEPMFEVREKS
jgi:predicted Zn-ribbon and HTH transcriptional regulator